MALKNLVEERKKKQAEGINAMWEEIEPSHKHEKEQTPPSPKAKMKYVGRVRQQQPPQKKKLVRPHVVLGIVVLYIIVAWLFLKAIGYFG